MQVARLLEPRAERTLARQAAPDRARDRARTRAEQGRDPALYLSLAPYGGNLEGVRAASLAYFGKEPRRLYARRSRAAGRARRSRRKRAAPIAAPMLRARARDRVLDRVARPARCRPTRSRAPSPSRCRPRARRCRCWRRMPPIRRSRPRRTASVHQADHRRRLCRRASKTWRAIAPARSARTSRSRSSQSTTRPARCWPRVALGRLFRRAPRRPGRHDARRCVRPARR